MILVKPQEEILKEDTSFYEDDSPVMVHSLMIAKNTYHKQPNASSVFGIIGVGVTATLLGTYTSLKQAQEVVSFLLEEMDLNEGLKVEDVGILTPVFRMPEDRHSNDRFKYVDEDYSIRVFAEEQQNG